LTGVLILLLFAIGIPASAMSFLMAKSSLSPLTQLTKKLSEVESTDLHHQLPVPNTQDEISKLTETFNAMLSRLDESFGRERQFIGDVAHELKTPLSTLISRIEVALSKNRNPDEFRNVMSENLVELNRLSATVNDVLDLAWAQSGEIETQFSNVDLSKLTEEIGELLENLSIAKKIQVVSEIAKGVEVSGIRQKLFRAVYNLADNAVKFTPVSGKIALSLRQEGKSAVLEVSNTGLGITPADMPNVFKRFYRGKVNSAEGTGLGLSICKSIVEAHHGSLNVASTPKKITTFTIKLPATSKSS
jgi:two-component system heavy metal sensor histidine kinase CusS